MTFAIRTAAAVAILMLGASSCLAADATPESIQALVARAQKAIDAAGPAAKEAFDVETGLPLHYPITSPENVRIVHKATGLQCGINDETQVTIKVYHTDAQGHATDVSCDLVQRSTAHTLYAYQHPGSSLDDEMRLTTTALTMRLSDAVQQAQSPFDTFEEPDRLLTLRDYDTIKDTRARAFLRPSPSPRGYYETIWLGQKDGWFIEQRSSGPGYWNWLASGLWHAVWRNMRPEMAAEEDKTVRALEDARQKAEQDKQAAPAVTTPGT